MFKKTTLALLTSMMISCSTNYVAYANTVAPKLEEVNETTITINDDSNNIVNIARVYETTDNKNSINDNIVSLPEHSKEEPIVVSNETIKTPTEATDSSTITKPKSIATYTMEATAYAGDTTTKMGVPTKREPEGISTIAVDPNVIPLGSKVYIPEYGYAIASDTGGAIKGHRVDLFLNSEEECVDFGRQAITLDLIALPGEW